MSIPERGRGRVVGRAVVTTGFVALLLVAATMSALARDHTQASHFTHHYPSDPVPLERPRVAGPAPRAPRASTLEQPLWIRSLRQLAPLLPAGALRRVGARVWRLNEPVDLTRGATLTLDGVALELAPGAFLQARNGGSLLITRSTITAVDRHGAPAVASTPSRPFLAARDGGRLVLRNDTIADLGHLATVSYGVSFRAPAPGCAIVATTIRGNYIGVFLSHTRGIPIVGNRIVDSSIYGIDPYGGSSDLLIARNYVARSGLHGIVLANHVTRTRVLGNQVVDVRVHGIVLFDHATANLVSGNRIAGAFDGLVVNGSSHNTVAGNTVERVTRFGLRVSAGSSANAFERNRIADALVGAYFYGGANGNTLIDTTFATDRENVRIRADAPGNQVRPTPPLSELR